jgi:hypothetical protein
MTKDLVIGLVSLAIAAGLFFVGLPDKNLESPRYLRFHSAPVIYPTIILVFFAIGVAELVNWYLTRS